MALETTLKLTTPTSLCWCLTTLVELGITVANVAQTVSKLFAQRSRVRCSPFITDYISEGDSPAFFIRW